MLGDGYSYGHQTMLATVSGPVVPGMESIRFFGAFEQSTEDDPYVKIANAFDFTNLVDQQPANSSYADKFDLSWKDGVTPGSSDEFTNITGTLTYDAGPLRATVGVVNNSNTNNQKITNNQTKT